jgi:hypothetical protein
MQAGNVAARRQCKATAQTFKDEHFPPRAEDILWSDNRRSFNVARGLTLGRREGKHGHYRNIIME